MRIGIITFHQAYNYGAVLQCYALCSVLKKMGCEVEVIDYIPKCFDAQHKLWSWYIFKKRNIFGKVEYLYSSLKGLRIRYSRNRKFNNFIKELPLTPFSTLDEWSEKQKFDIIFWGSDQVWNPMITGSIDLVYFGKFKTVFQMLMVIVMVANLNIPHWTLIGNILMYVALFLTILSLVVYMYQNRKVLADEK